MNKKKIVVVFVILLIIGTINIAALRSVKITGVADYLPIKSTTVMCIESAVRFKADNGKIYTGSVYNNSTSPRRCSYKIPNIPSGTKGKIEIKFTISSNNKVNYYTCFYKTQYVKLYSWDRKINISSSGWNPHSDSLIGGANDHMCLEY